MLTHGWRRYNIPEVVKGNVTNPQIPFQGSQKISGSVKSLALFTSVTDSKVSMMTKAGYLGFTTTDKNNTFCFLDFEYPDSASYFIQALSKRGSIQMEIIIDPEKFPKLIHAPQSPHLTPALSKGEGEREGGMVETKNETESNAFFAKAEQRSHYDEDMRVIHLNEVEVTARRIEKQIEPRQQYWVNESADVTIRRDRIEQTNPTLVSDILRLVSGVTVTPDGYVIIRNSMSSSGQVLPLILID